MPDTDELAPAELIVLGVMQMLQSDKMSREDFRRASGLPYGMFDEAVAGLIAKGLVQAVPPRAIRGVGAPSGHLRLTPRGSLR